MVSPRKDLARPPAPVAESWRRIEAWLDKHLLAVKATLRPGVSKRDLTRFEKVIGRALPEDVRQSWLIHDGQGHLPEEFYATDEPIPESLGLLFGNKLNPLINSKNCLSSRPVLAEWKFWKDLIEREDEPGYWDDFDGPCTSFPEGAIRCKYSHPGWLPLVTVMDSEYLGTDLAPGPEGVVGQLINFGRDCQAKYVLAASWAHFLEDFADELEAGNFVIDSEHEYGSFLLKRPRTEPLYTQYKAWSQAKFAPSMLRERRTP